VVDNRSNQFNTESNFELEDLCHERVVRKWCMSFYVVVRYYINHWFVKLSKLIWCVDYTVGQKPMDFLAEHTPANNKDII